MKKESFPTGVLLTLLSATGLSLAGLLGKVGTSLLSLEAMIFWRFFVAFILCLLISWITGEFHYGFSFNNPKRHLLRAVFVFAAQYSFYYYIQRSTLLDGLVLLSLGPLFIPFIERIVMRNGIGKSTWIGLIVSCVGMLCVLQPDAGIFSSLSLVGAFAGFSQGCSQVVLGMSTRHERPRLSITYVFLFCTLFSLFPYLVLEQGTPPHHAEKWIVGALILGLGIASVLNQLARALAYQHSTPSKLATFLYFSILLGGIFDWLFFGRIPNTLSIIGACLVIAGGVLKLYLRKVFLKNFTHSNKVK